MSCRFRLFDDAREYAAIVRSFLLQAEARNNVLLGVLRQLVSGEHDYEDPILLGALESDEGVMGCVWRTPPNKLGLTGIPGRPAEGVAEGVSKVYSWLEAAFGPSESVMRFGEAWSKHTGASYRRGMHRGVYELDDVTPPSRKAGGKMVTAPHEELPTVVAWVVGFRRDSGVSGGNPEVVGRRLVRSGRAYLWLDGGVPRSMAAAIAYTDHGVRIGHVYTPPEYRGRGYASMLVAQLSREILESGRDFCFLHADLANPTSTRLYTRLGYRKIGEALDVIFERQDV